MATLKEFEDLLTQTITKIDVVKSYEDMTELVFTLLDDTKYRLYHCQDCCENVYIESIVGDLNDLIGHPITLAREISSQNEDNLKAFAIEKNIKIGELENKGDESFTWTFYTLATIKGYVDIRWYCSSSGYYSETVSFDIIK